MIPADQPLISVVVCTRDRPASLRRLVESATALQLPHGLRWELLIVANGDPAATAAAVEPYRDRLPLRLTREPATGLSHARNRGVAEARGHWICWTDDDVLLDPQWLAAYADAIARYPEAEFFGGRIEPVIEGQPPAWFVENRSRLANLLAERDLGPEPERIGAGGCRRLPFGANYAVRADAQRRHPYDPELGLAPGRIRLGEETAVLKALAREGAVGYWLPAVRVRHLIPPTRQELGYVARYFRAAGETSALLGARGLLPPDAERPLRRRWLLARILAHGALAGVHRPRVSSSRWFHHWQRLHYCVGALRYRLRR